MTAEEAFDIDQVEIRQLKRKLGLEKALSEYETLAAEARELELREELRQMNVRYHRLQYENHELRAGLEEGDGRATEYARDLAILRLEKKELEETIREIKTELAGSRRETERLKVEIQTLNSLTDKSNKVLSEKLTLQHELNTLKAENEALRSVQETAKQNLQEKLSLQRQVTNLQLELENEKKTAKRTGERISDWQETEKKMKKEIQELKQSLAKETKAREKVEQAQTKTNQDYETRIQILQSKLSSTKTQLQALKEKAVPGTPARNNLKRPSMVPGFDDSIKKPKLAASRPGVISEFSVTPFLKRNAPAPVSPDRSNDTTGEITVSAEDTTHLNPVLIPTGVPTKLLLKPTRLPAGGAAKAKAKRRKSLLSDILAKEEAEAAKEAEPASPPSPSNSNKENTAATTAPAKPKSIKDDAMSVFSSPAEAPAARKPTSKAATAAKKPAKKPAKKQLVPSNLFAEDDGTGRIEVDLGDKPMSRPPVLKGKTIFDDGFQFSPAKKRPAGMKRITVPVGGNKKKLNIF